MDEEYEVVGTVEEDCREWVVEVEGLRGVTCAAVGFVRSLADPAGTNNGLRWVSSMRSRCPFCHASAAEGRTNPSWDDVLLKRAVPCELLGLIDKTRSLDEYGGRKVAMNLQFIQFPPRRRPCSLSCVLASEALVFDPDVWVGFPQRVVFRP